MIVVFFLVALTAVDDNVHHHCWKARYMIAGNVNGEEGEEDIGEEY